MNHFRDNDQESPSSTIKDFIPLIIILGIILTFTIIRQLVYGFNPTQGMYDFMGVFFIVFAAFKLYNLSGFVEAYTTYDIIAQRLRAYAYIYPFIELILGLCYFFRFNIFLAHWATCILMLISSLGVIQALRQKKSISCACLGTVFKLPMTYVTLGEDLLMGLMALYMLIHHHT